MKYSYNLSSFYNEDDISYYLLGAFIADGNVVKHGKGDVFKFRISSKDRDWIELIRNQFCQDLKIKDRQNFSELQIYNHELAKWLIANECVPSKSLTVKMPFVPDAFLPDFVRGCIDGDGSLGSYKYEKQKSNKVYSYSYEKIYLCSGSETFVVELSSRLNQIGIKHSLNRINKDTSYLGSRTIKPKNDHYRLQTSGKSAADFASWIYYPNHRIAMPRKAEIAKQIIQKFQE